MRAVVWGEPSLCEQLQARGALVDAILAEASLDVAVRLHRADVALVDAGADGRGLAALRGLTADVPALALVPEGGVLEAIAAGASGALRRDAAPEAVAAALRALREGLAVFDRPFVAALVPRDAGDDASKAALTSREHEVLALLAEGLSNREIASKLEISEHTAKFHVNSILQKMGAQKRVEAVVRAARLGIIEL